MPDNSNEWRKFRAIPQLYPFRSLALHFVLTGLETGRAFRIPGAGGESFPLCSGTFARSYSVKVARLQSEFCTKDFFSSHEFSYEKCSEIFPEIFEPLF